jgi:hypothetical protein
VANCSVTIKEEKGLVACPDHGGLLHAEKEYQCIMRMMMNYGGKGKERMVGRVHATIETKFDAVVAATAKESVFGFGGAGVPQMPIMIMPILVLHWVVVAAINRVVTQQHKGVMCSRQATMMN